MVYNKATGIKTKADVIFYVSAVIALLFGAHEILNRNNTASEIKPEIRSESFAWPEGCEIKHYPLYSKISISCAASENIFTSPVFGAYRPLKSAAQGGNRPLKIKAKLGSISAARSLEKPNVRSGDGNDEN